jgi:hypothetical protein
MHLSPNDVIIESLAGFMLTSASHHKKIDKVAGALAVLLYRVCQEKQGNLEH